MMLLMADSDHVMDTQPNDGATRSTGYWTPEEDVKLSSAITNTRKKKWGKKDRIDWAVVAALVGVDGTMPWIPTSTRRVDVRVHGQDRNYVLVLGRTKMQCTDR